MNKRSSQATFNMLIAMLVVALLVGFAGSAEALTIVGSRHDFSTTGTGTSAFSGNFYVPDPVSGFTVPIDQVCVFCHTPHGAQTGVSAPLWNRTSSPPAGGYTYKMYSSSTMSASVPVGGPTGISALCMSCHDGVTSIAVGTLLNPPGDASPGQVTTTVPYNGVVGAVYNGDPLNGGWRANLGNIDPVAPGLKIIDLSNDHPISFIYPTNAPGIKAPADTRLRLFGTAPNKTLECATCHLVHDNAFQPFLAMPNDTSQMCLACHIK